MHIFRRQHVSQEIKLNATSNKTFWCHVPFNMMGWARANHMWVFLPKIQNLILIRIKHQTNLNWGHSTKIIHQTLQMCQGHLRNNNINQDQETSTDQRELVRQDSKWQSGTQDESRNSEGTWVETPAKCKLSVSWVNSIAPMWISRTGKNTPC